MIKKCKICGLEFDDKTKNQNRLYCSNQCNNISRRKGFTYIKKKCIICNKEFEVKTTHKFANCCSKQCSIKNWNKNNVEYNKQRKKQYRIENADRIKPYNKKKSKERRQLNPNELPQYRKSNLKYSTQFIDVCKCDKCGLIGRMYIQTTTNLKTKHIGNRLVVIHKPNRDNLKKCYLGQCDKLGKITKSYL